MKITYKLLAELIEFIIKNTYETNDVNELLKWLNKTDGYISKIGGRR